MANGHSLTNPNLNEAMMMTNGPEIRAMVLDNYLMYAINVVALCRPNVDSVVSDIDRSFVVNSAMIAH